MGGNTPEKSGGKFKIDFEQAVVDNPLQKYPPEQIDEVATSFAKHFEFKGLEDLFRKAAHCARDPGLAHTVSGLTDEEKETLRSEGKASFWAQPKQLKIAILTCCLGAVIQGWNQTGSNGANMKWPGSFTPPLSVERNDDNTTDKDVWTFSIVNAVTYFTAALVGTWISDPLQELLFGRRAALFVAALSILTSTIGSGFVNTVAQLIGARVVLGVGMGCKASVIPIYSAEISPGRIRGALGVNWQIFDALGIALGFAANLILENTGDSSWRFMMASACVPALPFLVLVFVCPESPRFLIKKGDYKKAYRSLVELREVPLLAARDLFYMHVQLLAETKLLSKGSDFGIAPDSTNRYQEDSVSMNSANRDIGVEETYQNEIKKINYFDRVLHLVRVPRVRRSAVAAFAIMISQQLCGFNVLAFYSSTYFDDFISDSDSLWLSFGVGLANFLFGLPAYWLIEKWGRRTLLLLSIPGMCISLLACGAAFYIEDSGTRIGIVVFFLFVFTMFYSPGVGPVPFAMSSEIFMSVNREVGMSWAVWVNLFFAGVLSLCVPPAMILIGNDQNSRDEVTGRILFAFAVLNVVAFALCYFLVPETSGATISKSSGNPEYMSLEELNYIFATPTSKHVKYQTKIVLPWAINKVIPGRPYEPRPDPLHRWEKYEEQQSEQDQIETEPHNGFQPYLEREHETDSSISRE
ncbi:hypothetical protein FQN54_005213 [Arachnomyces sp. PD_36]|nr:hypothetical protein FQN54_005213 [Arachnomyces sp. PD_36]